MSEENEFALVPRPSTAIQKADSGAQRVLSSIVTDAMGLVWQKKLGFDGSTREETATLMEIMCPKSGRPVLDRGAFWNFPGYEGINFPKTLCRRTMTLEEYVNMLKSESPIYLKGFASNRGNPFTAAIVLIPEEKKLYFEFPSR